MDAEENDLQKVSYELTFPQETVLNKARTDPTLPISKLRSVEYALKSMQRFVGKDVLLVSFDLPKRIQLGLQAGEYIRKGGVIVTSDKKQVVQWLREGKKVSKLGTLAFSTLDIVSEIALNEKLKQIQNQLVEIEKYVKARHEAFIPMAHESLRHGLLSSNPSEKANFFQKAESDFQKAQNEMLIFVQDIVRANHIELTNFNESRYSNVNDLKEICKNLNDLMRLSKGIAHCMEGRIAINTERGNVEVAADIKLKLVDYLTNVGEYADYFIEGNCDYTGLEFVKLLPVDASFRTPINKITARIKRFTVEDLSFLSWRDLLRRKENQERFKKSKNVSVEYDQKFGESFLNKHLQFPLIEDVRIMVVNFTEEIIKDSGVAGPRDTNPTMEHMEATQTTPKRQGLISKVVSAFRCQSQRK